MNSYYFVIHVYSNGKLATVVEYEHFMRIVNFVEAVKKENLESKFSKRNKVEIYKNFVVGRQLDQDLLLYQFYVSDSKECARLALMVK